MTEPSHELASAAALLARAWARRSPAERSAFARLAVTPEFQAALSGAVSPADLTHGLDPETATRALDLLAPEFDRIQTSERWLWTLRSDPRRATLTSLSALGQLADRLAEVSNIPTDRAGELLRQLAAIRPRQGRREVTLPDSDQMAMVQALTWARPLGGCADPGCAEGA